MPAITFSHLTKEIEFKGSESFVESNFSMIEKLIIECFGSKMKRATVRIKAEQKPMSVVKESQIGVKMGSQQPSNSSQPSPGIMTPMQDVSHVIRINRPPLRKYIRKVGIPGQERIIVEVVDQKPKELTLVAVEQKSKELTLAELKEKFGLSESKYGKTIWDDQKHDGTKKVMNG